MAIGQLQSSLSGVIVWNEDGEGPDKEKTL